MRRSAINLFVALMLVAGLGWLDYLTGTEVRAVLFYLIPITFVAWRNGRKSVLAVALASGLSWALAEFNLKSYDSIVVAVWNELSALTVFSLVGLMIVHVRRERDQIRLASQRIQELLQVEERIARTDPLTGLPNSREFAERMAPEMARCRRDSTPLCVLYIDLDNFKRVNDRHGHTAGDDVLRLVADALRQQIRAADIPARLGGDEFAVMLWQPAAADAQAVGERIVDAVVKVGAKYPDCELGASIGVVWFEKVPDSVDEVIRQADEAMYTAKKAGKRRTTLIRPAINSAAD